MAMISNLLPWLIVWPALASLILPLIGAAPHRRRGALFALAHLGGLGLAMLLLISPPAGEVATGRFGWLELQLSVAPERPVAATLALSALILLLVSGASRPAVRDARQGTAFLSALLLEQAGVNLALLADDLLTLYVGLLIVSLALTLMIGIDFVASGGSAALRMVATLEVPAAFALAAFWLIDAHAGTVALRDLPHASGWLGSPGAWALLLPIVLAVLGRAGLAPLQGWVVIGCRAAILPAAVAVAAVALPVGGLVLARLVATVIPPASPWLQALLLLGGLTTIVGGVGALREATVAGWLGYLAIGEAGLAAIGFVDGSPAGRLAGSVELATLAVAITLVGLSLASVPRLAAPGGLPGRWRVHLPFLIGLMALAPVPLSPSFTARWLLIASLLNTRSTTSQASAAMALVGTLLLAASIWRVIARARQPATAPSPSASPAKSGGSFVGGGLVALAALGVLAGATQSLWEPLTDDGVAAGPRLLAVLLVSVAVVGAAGLGGWPVRRRAIGRSAARLEALWQRWHPDRLLDPYLLIGWILLTLGRLSARLLDQTLGRLARAP